MQSFPVKYTGMVIKIFGRIRSAKPEFAPLAAATLDLRMTLQITGQTIGYDLPLRNKFSPLRKKCGDFWAQ